MMTFGRRRVLAAGTVLAVSRSAGVQAQAAYPDHAIRFVGGFPPGGPADLSGRMLAQSLSEVLGQQVVVENKSGAAGNIASQVVAESRPDGYTLLIGTSIMSIVPAMYDKLPYDPLSSLIAIAHFTTVPMIIVVPADGPKSIEELVALLRQEPGKHSYGSPGNGSLIHMGSLLFAQRAGGEALHVPYRGSAPAMQDMLAGRHAFQIDTLGSSKGFIDAGRLRILAVCTNERMAALPDVPTVKEKTGFPLEVVTWYLIFAPAGTPQPIVDKLSVSINQAITAPAIVEKAAALGMEMVPSTPASSKKFYEQQMALWAPIVKASGAKVE
ncbi:MAG TPA: tripartite tricarboxylate transporter substrate binding protein [Reyranella sp.]|jgi:tripartite-type tricarboxylate transporter receptor subunit TctC|nr:tripartite tricarboxylate transporter substrate binding protein [Reyranella sp.]